MKTVSIIFLQGAFLSFAAFANGEYDEAMKKNIAAIYAAESLEALQQSVNAFERIASAEKTKWEPFYYAGFGYILMANKEKDGATKDKYLDQAMAAIKNAKEIAGEESEVIALEGFAYMISVTVDPGTRGPQLAGLAMQTFGKAISLNPENPRAIILMARMQFGTAQFFGSPTTEACGTADKALEKFETYHSENSLGPQWGKAMAEELKTACQ